MVANLIKDPGNEKYRVVSTLNPKFNERIGQYPSYVNRLVDYFTLFHCNFTCAAQNV